ncbi:MAG: hypothetical protein ACK5T6_06365, partial [Pirellula sp.]
DFWERSLLAFVQYQCDPLPLRKLVPKTTPAKAISAGAVQPNSVGPRVAVPPQRNDLPGPLKTT